MTLEQLGKRAEFWCQLLGIEELWDVTVEVGNTGNMDGFAGLNFINGEHQSSKIMVAPDEGEDTLVHEILHIILDGHKSDEERNYSVMHERAINKIATALVELSDKKRSNAKAKSTRPVLQAVKPARGKKNRKASNSKVTSRSR